MKIGESPRITSVSYTHLDVYKRQVCERTILALENGLVNAINNCIVQRFPEDKRSYNYVNTILNEEDTCTSTSTSTSRSSSNSTEVLNNLSKSGLAMHMPASK